MHSMSKKFLSLALLFSSSLYSLSPYYAIRSQGLNSARTDAGIYNHLFLDTECLNGNFFAAVEYTRSFRPQNITSSIFGTDLVADPCSCGPVINISGSQVANRAATDWLADYFGLPTDFQSSVGFSPLIQNYIIDLNFYFGLDSWVKGLYLRVDAPITHTKWDMQMREVVGAAGANIPVAGYYSAGSPAGTLLSSFTDFASGNSVPTFPATTYTNSTTGVVTAFPGTTFQPLANAVISPTSLIRAGLADLRVALGWNYACEYYHVGIDVRCAAPTGLKPAGQYTFEPMIGNGHSWELGVGLTSHYDFWSSDCSDAHAGFLLEGNITHLFTSQQSRTFDLLGKQNSRFMLAEQIGSTQQAIHLANPPFPAVEFQGVLTPVANLTTLSVNVSAAVQGEVLAMLNWTGCGWEVNVGYNFWGRSCEKIIKNSCPSPLDDGMTWALKGDASVIGFDDNPLYIPFAPVNLAATESQATIHAGTNFPISGSSSAVNGNIDSPMSTLAGASDGFDVLVLPASTALPTNSSVPPVFLSLSSVDFSGTKGISNKIFAYFAYTWTDRDNWTPYLGIGGEAEFGSNSSCPPATGCFAACATSCTPACPTTTNPACPQCFKCSVSQWGVWLEGGVSFN